MDKIVNLTSNLTTDDQKNVGVVDIEDRELVADLLNFDDIPTAAQIHNRAEVLASLVDAPVGTTVLIGGPQFLMSTLTESLKKRGYIVVFECVTREVIHFTNDRGDMIQSQIFRHLGFIEA